MRARVSKELATTRRPATVPHLGPEARLALDVALGVAGVTAGAAVAAARTVQHLTAPVARLLWRPPLLPARFHPATVVDDLARTGGVDREELSRRAEALLDAWVPVIVAMVVERLDLTRLVEENVDLDEIVSTVDLDAAVARVDLDAAVRRVDLDAAVALVDIESVIDRVDLDAVVATVDLDAAVSRVDIDRIINRVDLDGVAAKLDVDAVVARADLDAVIDRIDVIGIVEDVLDVIDLPGIIRDSTGSMASETVRGVRMTGVSADEALAKVVDRALFRRRRAQELPGAPT